MPKWYTGTARRVGLDIGALAGIGDGLAAFAFFGFGPVVALYTIGRGELLRSFNTRTRAAAPPD